MHLLIGTIILKYLTLLFIVECLDSWPRCLLVQVCRLQASATKAYLKTKWHRPIYWAFLLERVSFAFISLFSFIGGVIAVVITAFIARLFKGVNYSISLLLSGIVVAGFMNSFVGIAKSVSNMSQLASITYWLLGGFYNARYEQLVIVCPIIFVCIVCLILLRWKIVMLQNSDEDAQSHGINVKRVRAAVIILSTLITALSVAISGTVGWIGLAIPNLINLIVKNDSKKTIILSVIVGSLFACICDLLCRTLTTSEIPVGILTGIFGAIIFIVVLIVRRVQNG